jgi:RHS repeat-associated protein
VLLRDDNSTSGSLGISGSGLGRRLFSEHDANFDATALTNTSGVVQERFIDSPYGTVTVLSPTWTSTTDSFGWGYLFQGMWRDPVTGLYYTPNRDYSAALGRWMEQDPAGYLNGTSLFAFVSDGPADFVDPSGLERRSGGYDSNAPQTLIGELPDLVVNSLANKQATDYDVVRDKEQLSSKVAYWKKQGWPVAAAMLSYFMTGKGGTYSLDAGLDKRAHDIIVPTATFKEALASDLDTKYGTIPVNTPTKVPASAAAGFAIRYLSPLDGEVFFAFGSLAVSYSGTIVRNGKADFCYALTFQIQKTYNFGLNGFWHYVGWGLDSDWRAAHELEDAKSAASFVVKGEFQSAGRTGSD